MGFPTLKKNFVKRNLSNVNIRVFFSGTGMLSQGCKGYFTYPHPSYMQSMGAEPYYV